MYNRLPLAGFLRRLRITIPIVLVLMAVGVAAGGSNARASGAAPPPWPAGYRASQIKMCTSPPSANSVTLCTCITNRLEKQLSYKQMHSQTAAVLKVRRSAVLRCLLGPAAKPPPPGTTLTQARGVGLYADGAAWENGGNAYFTLALSCLSKSSGGRSSCLHAAFAKWSVPFSRARQDARADAQTVTGVCRTRLLAYLGSSGAGDAFAQTMGFAQKDALGGKLALLNQTLRQLLLPAFETTDKALRAAEDVC